MASERTSRQKIRQLIHAGASLNAPYLLMNALATIVACYGLLANSTAVVIGAMVIAMLLGPITGIALGLVDGDNRLLRHAFLAEVVGASMVLVIAFAIGLLYQDIPVGTEITGRTAPNIFDLIIALAGGAAGAYAIASPRISAGLVGVAIATALVPPLSTCGLLLARGQLQMAFGAFLLFFANLIAIQFASSVVLWFLGYRQLTSDTQRSPLNLLIGNGISGTLLIVLALILGFNFTQSISKQLFESRVRGVVSTELAMFPDAQLVDTTFTSDNTVLSLLVTVRTSRQPTHAEILNLQIAIATDLQQTVALKLIVVPTVKLDPLIPPTPTPTPRPEDTPTFTVTPSPLPSNTATASATATATDSPTPTDTATSTPTFTPTPVSATIANTKGVGVALRAAPNGKILGTLPEGAPLQVLYRRETVNYVEWVEVRDVLNRVGWVPARTLIVNP